MIERIGACLFLEAFRSEWEAVCESNNPSEILLKYKSNTAWTRFMLTYPGAGDDNDQGGFLARICWRLGGHALSYKQEYYTLDALFVGGDNLFGAHHSYPQALHCLIEHENGERIEEEMWKLIFWRSPLKVLVFYDYWEDERRQNSRKAGWCEYKLSILRTMLDKANAFHPEADNTEYLFLVGNLPASINASDNAPLPQWRYATNSDWALKPLT